MYGAIIGDIVGSKYEFNNIKTKDFPLFSEGCDYTDDTIMTVAVAKAILLSRHEQHKKRGEGKGFQEFLIEIMQDFGRRYPYPAGGYGGRFASWLRSDNPMPYGSYGNGSAMRVSPCALAAVTMEEACVLARVSVAVTHDHPEGIKGAEAVCAAVFLAKYGESKEEIRKYIEERYYKLNFTLADIRESYGFNETCQGSVPQAIVAFLESESFEDAIRNVVSIGGDCDTTGAITGSIAWVYYAGYYDWVTDHLNPSMKKIKEQAMAYLPKEFIEVEDEFMELCNKRSAAFNRLGFVDGILNHSEWEKYDTDWEKSDVQSSPSETTEKDALFHQQYTLEYLIKREGSYGRKMPGAFYGWHDRSMKQWRLQIQLDHEGVWFLTISVRDDGGFEQYSLDEELANDSHYEFVEEQEIRKRLYISGDENRYFHEILIRFVKVHGGGALLSLIKPYVMKEFHYYD